MPVLSHKMIIYYLQREDMIFTKNHFLTKKGGHCRKKKKKNEWRIFWQLAPTPSNITTNINTCEKNPEIVPYSHTYTASIKSTPQIFKLRNTICLLLFFSMGFSFWPVMLVLDISMNEFNRRRRGWDAMGTFSMHIVCIAALELALSLSVAN